MTNKTTTKCPDCNYEFSIDESTTQCFCQKCGKVLRIENEVITTGLSKIEKYNKSLKSWKKTSFVIALITLICDIVVLTSDIDISVFFLFIGIAFGIFGPVAIAITEPDGSNIKNSGLRKPNRVINWLKYLLVFLLLGVIAFSVSTITYSINRA